MAIVGYARVSTTDQNTAVQIDLLKAAGATDDTIFQDRLSGLDKDRPKLAEALRFVRKGDILVVTKVDRLARSAAHLHQIVEELTKRGVEFKVLNDPSLDTTKPHGKLLFGILASIAEFETALRKERQMEGIAKRRAEGGPTWGRPKTVTNAVEQKVRDMRAEGGSLRAIAAAVGYSTATVQAIIKA
ncbi:Site-specific DNA recombinase [Mesorhizobium albiziae]|uniref:Site-specific DNA recombinase n=1 Tax=Neomesorhizobium albiziae TaxID=335020 RepID=A0A1I3UWL1_9HYPH|nr:recombinase family protein [Mesorhizobium albiziae]GLS28467.1 DNA invertase [Mesorhizobium albiziae]SFJ86231.1 Site-specific DNA recombinase [Mesorhizobium albiziae]